MNDKILQEVEFPEPVGKFILENAKGIMMPNGEWFHYADVCTLLTAYHERMKQEDVNENKSLCVNGCMHYTGGEIKHHKDCPYYPDSLSRRLDELEARSELDKIWDDLEHSGLNAPLPYLMKVDDPKAEQKQHLVELTRLGDEPVAPKVEGDELLINAIDNLIIEVYSGMSLENIEEELKAIKEMIALKPIAGFCFTENDINDLIPGPYHPEGTQIKKVLAKLNTKANQYAEERIKEKDAMLHALEEGAEQWREEYDACRKILIELCSLKKEKDSLGKTDHYLEHQPLVWKAAFDFIQKYQHQ